MQTPKRLKGMHTPSHARSRNQEREIARRVGGCVTRGSGCGNEKGDVRLRGVCRIEAKTTKHNSFSVTREMIVKIEDAALSSGELPAIVVEFIDGAGKPCGSVAVVPLWSLEMMLENQKQ